MIATLTLLALGFLFGMRHATDPDHVVAVSTIVAQRRSVLASSTVGALWGLGHTLMILLVGGVMVLFEVVVPPRAFLAAEFGVAVMLVALGCANLRRPHGVASGSARPFVVGTVHGLAGSGALVALGAPLVADPRLAMAALLCFGIGTIAGMMLVTGIIAMPARYATARSARAGEWLRVASGVASVVFGLFLAHHVGVVEGLLFRSSP